MKNTSTGKKVATAKNTIRQNEKSENENNSKLRKLFEDELKDIFWAEKALLKAIPKMIKKATTEELVEALETHLDETEGQVSKLEQVFESIGKTAQAKKCEAMNGLIKEAESIMEDTEEGVVRDAGIISAAQKIEHYEIASYGTLRTFANTLGFNEAATLLEEILDEEKNADEKLTEIAVSSINSEAAGEEE